jgi:hypothetical protein
MIEKTRDELNALAHLYNLANGKFPTKVEEINLKTLNIPDTLAKGSAAIVEQWPMSRIQYLLEYLGKHIQDCYDYETK